MTGSMIIKSLYEENERLKADLEVVRGDLEALIQKDYDRTSIIAGIRGDAEVRSEVLGIIGACLAVIMEDGEGGYNNFAEAKCTHPKAGPMVLTLQRLDGKTPLDMIKELKAELNNKNKEVSSD